MSRVVVWEWVPEQYTPKYICGPDEVMQRSLYARFGGHGGLFGVGMCLSKYPSDSAVVCPYMNGAQKLQFLLLHCQRYGYKMRTPEDYVPLVRSIESVEYAICLDRAGVSAKSVAHQLSPSTLEWEFRTRNNFPSEIAAAATLCWKIVDVQSKA